MTVVLLLPVRAIDQDTDVLQAGIDAAADRIERIARSLDALLAAP